MYTDEMLIQFTKPISDKEEEKAQHSIKMVQEAIDQYDWSSANLPTPSVNLKGSYNNDTNIREDSDVDIYVLFSDSYLVNRTTQDKSLHHTGGSGKAPILYRNNLAQALISRFGSDNITRGNKSFKIRGTQYKHQTDVVCAFVANDESGDKKYQGICLVPDKTPDGLFHLIINYPEQDTYYGKQLNAHSDYYYKKIVRILKGIRNDLNLSTPSFLIECLVSNVDPLILSDNTKDYRGKVLAVIDNLIPRLRFPDSLKEVNGIKPLFHEKQKWGSDTSIALNFLNNVKVNI